MNMHCRAYARQSCTYARHCSAGHVTYIYISALHFGYISIILDTILTGSSFLPPNCQWVAVWCSALHCILLPALGKKLVEKALQCGSFNRIFYHVQCADSSVQIAVYKSQCAVLFVQFQFPVSSVQCALCSR